MSDQRPEAGNINKDLATMSQNERHSTFAEILDEIVENRPDQVQQTQGQVITVRWPPATEESSTMAVTKTQLADAFNEWARRYADDPDSFSEVLGEDGRPIEDYGAKCAAYLCEILGDMAGRLTPPTTEA